MLTSSDQEKVGERAATTVAGDKAEVTRPTDSLAFVEFSPWANDSRAFNQDLCPQVVSICP